MWQSAVNPIPRNLSLWPLDPKPLTLWQLMGCQYSPPLCKIQNKSRLAKHNFPPRPVDPLCTYSALPDVWGDGTFERPAAKRQIWGTVPKCQEEDLAISLNPQDMRWGDTERGGQQEVRQDHDLKPPCNGELQMQNFPSCLKGREVSKGGWLHHSPGGLSKATSASSTSFLHAKLPFSSHTRFFRSVLY